VRARKKGSWKEEELHEGAMSFIKEKRNAMLLWGVY